MVGHGAKFDSKKDLAITALLSHRNVEEAAKGTQEVSSNIGGVTEAANSTGAVANQVLASARSLTEQSGALRALVQTFLAEVKAA